MCRAANLIYSILIRDLSDALWLSGGNYRFSQDVKAGDVI